MWRNFCKHDYSIHEKSSSTCIRSSHPKVFLEKGVLKLCSKFTGEHPYRSVISNFIKITLRQGYSPVSLLHIFRTPFLKTLLDGCYCCMYHETSTYEGLQAVLREKCLYSELFWSAFSP